jgi:transposase-like protein
MNKNETISSPQRGKYPRTIKEFDERFATERDCIEYLAHIRWPEGFKCPVCGATKACKTARGNFKCNACQRQTSPTAGTIFEGTRKPLRIWFRAMWYVTNSKQGVSALELQRVMGFGSYQTAWSWLHKMRRAMVRPGRDKLTVEVEVDETYIGGEEHGVIGRETEKKSLVAIAAEVRGKAMGRIRMCRIPDISSATLVSFIKSVVAEGAVVHTDGLTNYKKISEHGYIHHPTSISASGKPAHDILPRTHRVASLLGRWCMGTHQGAISDAHLDYYLDEFTFRFNRRSSKSRGLLFYRLVEQSVQTLPSPYKKLIGGKGHPTTYGSK